ncbi:MarR family winged helix-turn-helix transcriptional regulator [Paenibacillus sp. 1001270B_150601_E10]|uniref:MarR family winged helix-turn-helix transcriptional regulator n=1 Tax=Paenibacillus sp. 1001270B_150601_E10 TaxID=2787079 RepID=UPI00189DF3B0|nr:MarR family transcriptional regulator [Paenibacillus sp. 1001270B_150601_E10]
MDRIQDYANRVGLAMWKTHRRMSAEMAEYKEHGLTGPQFFMLNMIAHEGPTKVARLAERMEVKPSATTVMLDRLEQGGFILREMDKNDRRAVIVSLTAKGKDVLKKAKKESNKVLSRFLSVLTDEELETFTLLYEKLIPEEVKE